MAKKRHSFTSHPHDATCYRCGQVESHLWHRERAVLYTRGEFPVRCLNTDCNGVLRRYKTPARDFATGRDSAEWQQDYCPHCHCPYQFRPYGLKEVEFQSLVDHESGRLPIDLPELV